MIILESSVLIAKILENDVLHQRANRLLEDVEEPLVIPTSVLTETCLTLHRNTGDKEFCAVIARWLCERFSILGESESVVKRAVDFYQSEFRTLSLVDCLVLSMAESHGCGILSFDDDLKKFHERIKKQSEK